MLDTTLRFVKAIFEIFVNALWKLAWSLVIFVLVILFIVSSAVAVLVQVLH